MKYFSELGLEYCSRCPLRMIGCVIVYGAIQDELPGCKVAICLDHSNARLTEGFKPLYNKHHGYLIESGVDEIVRENSKRFIGQCPPWLS